MFAQPEGLKSFLASAGNLHSGDVWGIGSSHGDPDLLEGEEVYGARAKKEHSVHQGEPLRDRDQPNRRERLPTVDPSRLRWGCSSAESTTTRSQRTVGDRLW